MVTFTLSAEDHEFLLSCLAAARQAVIQQPFLGSMSADQQQAVQRYILDTVCRIDDLSKIVG